MIQPKAVQPIFRAKYLQLNNALWPGIQMQPS